MKSFYLALAIAILWGKRSLAVWRRKSTQYVDIHRLRITATLEFLFLDVDISLVCSKFPHNMATWNIHIWIMLTSLTPVTCTSYDNKWSTAGVHCTTAPVGTWLHWSTGSRSYGSVRRDGQYFGREAQCGRQTETKWTKTAHNTHLLQALCTPQSLHRHTHTHTSLFGYGLSTGPNGGLSSWWLSDRSPLPLPQQPKSNNDCIPSCRWRLTLWT